MTALAQACKSDPDFPAEITAVISNNPDAAGLKTASAMGFQTLVVNHRDFDNRGAFEAELAQSVASFRPDLVCLAGFMRLLKGDMLTRFEGKILNIHPSLLPDYKGLEVHERVIKAGERESGCSVHFVTREMDGGDVIVQKRVPVLAEDTPEILANRVLEQEHIAYPEAVRVMAAKLTATAK